MVEGREVYLIAALVGQEINAENVRFLLDDQDTALEFGAFALAEAFLLLTNALTAGIFICQEKGDQWVFYSPENGEEIFRIL